MTAAKRRVTKTSEERQYLASSRREKVVEHLFLGELLRYLWVQRIAGVQVLKPEVDATGYDLVLQLGPVIRHVQLKSSMHDGRAAYQPVHESLEQHPSGCVVWMVLKDDLTFAGFRWFGGTPGKRLPALTDFRRARHTRANSLGIKTERRQTRRVPKSAYTDVSDMEGLAKKLFGRSLGGDGK